MSLFTVRVYLQVTLHLAALAEGGGLVRPAGCTPTRVCQQNLGASHRLLSCQAGADTLAEAEWGRADKWEGSVSRQREVPKVYMEGVLSSQHRELPSPPPSWHQDLPVPSLTLQQGCDLLDNKALFVNMLLICNFENKIETSCILKYKMKCDTLYTI